MEFNLPIQVGNSGRMIDREVLSRAVEKALKAIEYELPAEARTLEAYRCVLDSCEKTLEQDKKIVL